MRNAIARSLVPALLATFTAALAGLVLYPSASRAVAAEAAAPQPAKKDSRPITRPKTVTLTTSVEPEVARAGETVSFQVTAKLKPGFHIYQYSKKSAEDGPENTQFDLFDTSGLEVAGDWTASRPPIRKKEEVFPKLEFVEFFEDEVTWSIPLRVPPGTEPGKRILRVQARYQVCDAKGCSIPGQWTLPDATLTIEPGAARAVSTPAPAPATATLPPAAADTPKSTAPAPATATPSPPVAADTPKSTAATEGSDAPSSRAEVSEAAKTAERGILPFLLFSALGGLSALVMPCVWPMVPITVNFFVKQGQAKKGSTTGLAVAYCLAIIGVFTAVGVLFSFFFSATSLQRLANNPWLNLAVAGLFLLFGLSLLGFFEIRLPNFLLNASAKGEGRGGLIGVVFMALTLTITSFTCTFPVVGGLLVMAAGGQFFYPILGMATFATVLALPFFLLALAPGLLSRMPKSGDWMNAVKVVGGLVEIGAALKFLNTAELSYVTPENAFFDAQLVLSAWVALAAVCGLYLLGIFRTDHDHEEVKIGPGRLVGGTLFLGLALFFAPALFGRPPQSQVWFLVAGILPPDAAELNAPVPGPGGGGGAVAHETKAQSPDPETAEREQTNFHGVPWGMSLEAARERSRAENKPILIDFTGVNCANCRTMELSVLPRPEVVEQLGKFITVQLYTDIVPINSINADQRQALAEKNQDRLLAIIDDATNPFYVALGPDDKVLGTSAFTSAPKFVDFLEGALAKFGDTTKVARAEPSR